MPLSDWQQRCLRADLLIEPMQDADGKPLFAVSVPDTGELYHFGQEELFLAQALDGRQPLEELAERLRERFGVSAGEERIAGFFAELQDMGLLCDCDLLPAPPQRQPQPEPEPAPAAEPEPMQRRAVAPPGGAPAGGEAIDDGYGEADEDDDEDEDGRRAPGRFRLFDPDRVFAASARLLYPLRWLVWLLLPGVPLALLVLLFNQPQYEAHLALIFSGDQFVRFLLLFLFTLLSVNLLSKLVQGIVALHFGASVGSFGIRLAFGVKPRFFIAKKAIWRLHRRGRLWGFGSALLTKLALFVIGILVWIWTYHSSPSLALFALTAGHAGLATFLFTANPLWRADGYAWLVSYFELPKLRERAFHALQVRLVGGPGATDTAASPGERAALIGFAVATLAFFVYFIGFILFALAVALEARLQGTGVVLFLILTTLFLRWLLRTTRAKRERVGAALRRRQEQQFLPPFEAGTTLPATTGALAVATDARPPAAGGPSPALGLARRLLLIGMLVIVALLPYGYRAGGEATVQSATRADARARASGELIAVQVAQGDWVEQGQLLGTLDDWEQRLALRATQAEIATKRAGLALLQAAAKPEAVEQASKELARQRVEHSHSQKLVETLRAGIESGAVTELELASAEKTAAVDAAEVAVAESQLALVQSPPLAEEVAVIQAELAALEERLETEQEALERTRIVAPIAGRVVTPDLGEALGRFLSEGDLLAAIEDDRSIDVRMLVPETDIDDVRLGAATELRIWADPGARWRGQVTSIAPVAEESPTTPFMKVVPVTSRIGNPRRALLPGMTGYGKIEAGQRLVAVAFGAAVVRFFLIELWSWIP